jgi:hypothetical protein
MGMRQLDLESLREQQRGDSAQRFAGRYLGLFLVPVGFLSVEELAAGHLSSTGGVRFGYPLRHDAKQAHPLAGRVFFLEAGFGEITLGRVAGSDLAVPDDSVSEQHCSMEVTTEGNLRVVDQVSTNGTKVNLQEISPEVPATLGDEDILTVGRYSFQLHSPQSLFDALKLLDLVETPEP